MCVFFQLNDWSQGTERDQASLKIPRMTKQSQRLKGYVARAPRPESEIWFQDSETLETLISLISTKKNSPWCFCFLWLTAVALSSYLVTICDNISNMFDSFDVQSEAHEISVWKFHVLSLSSFVGPRIRLWTAVAQTASTLAFKKSFRQVESTYDVTGLHRVMRKMWESYPMLWRILWSMKGMFKNLEIALELIATDPWRTPTNPTIHRLI